MNILVTGGAGFIGSHVCERLLGRGDAVWAFDDLNPFYDPQLKQGNLRDIQSLAEPFEFVYGDLTDRAALDELFGGGRFDQVIHLAARAGVRPSLQEPALYQRVNVEGTTNLLEAARLHGVRKLTLASSSSVYGVNSKVPFAESDPIFNAISPYAASKLACEALGHVYHHVYGLDVVMLRFFTVYGPRQRTGPGDSQVCPADARRTGRFRFSATARPPAITRISRTLSKASRHAHGMSLATKSSTSANRKRCRSTV